MFGKKSHFIIEQGAMMKTSNFQGVPHILLTRIVEVGVANLWEIVLTYMYCIFRKFGCTICKSHVLYSRVTNILRIKTIR